MSEVSSPRQDGGATRRGRALTTRSVPKRESLEFWHDAVFETLVGMDIQAPGNSYDASLWTDRLGRLRITTVDCEPGEVHRSPRRVSRGDGRDVFVAVQARGRAQVEQDGRTTELRVGDLCFFETLRPFRTRFPEPFQLKIFAVPRALLGRQEAELRSLTARALPPHSGPAAVLAPFLSRLADASAPLEPALAERLSATVIDLLASAAAERLGQPQDELPGAGRVLLLRVRAFIRWHLADPELTPQTIARAHGISVRYLHRLFQEDGTTVSSWIRELRLQEARKDLMLAGRSVDLGQVARRWGFSGTAQLGRAFRSRHGVAPTDWLHDLQGAK